MPAPESVLKLCETFAAHRGHYRSSAYNETELRREFLDPLFKALGWDIDNEQGYADAYKDVIHEDAIKVGGNTKAPDYCFRIGGTRKFFLEAKKPSVNIKDDISPAYQLRRYAWSAKLPLSILSDFEEFAIYDCRAKPFPKDKPSASRTFYCTFDQIPEKWDDITAIFSPEAIRKGSFDKYAEATKGKRGTAEVDADFLAEIERWRDLLARNFALRNPSLTVRDLNFAVQKTIDRIIFLRICEDRGTEDYERLRKRLSGKDLYPVLLDEFRRADDRYNSGLFHFTSEKGHTDAPDTLTTSLALDDKVIADIVKNLYYPDSSFEFSVMPADILGQVYEQFLGKTIRLTSSHQAKIEEKPEVRKAGGVYYTPKYIVDHIVENTLGRLLNGEPSFQAASSTTIAKKPAGSTALPIPAAAKLKVLDPACGSGSFLIVAYQYLLDWHRDQYTLDPATLLPDEAKAARHAKGADPVIYQGNGGEWKLTITERKRILLNNIHGVDIDSQAVEVTKLSLLLKVLEGETSTTAQRDLFSERQRILPDLGANIRCGNSLIGPDFYDQPGLPALDDEAKYRINVFDWKQAFPQVFQQGGFDCVIGNPPYVRQESIKESKGYLSTRYASASGTADLYAYFMEKGVELLNPTGLCSYIVSSSFLKTAFAVPLRRTLAKTASILSITDFGGLPVFASAKDTYVCIPLFGKIPQPERITIRKVNTLEPVAREEQMASEGYTVPGGRFTEAEWPLRNDVEEELFGRILSYPTLHSTLDGQMYYGIKTGFNAAFVINAHTASKLLSSKDKHTSSFIHPAYGGQDVRRYELREKVNDILVIPCGWTRERFGILSEPQAWNRLSAANPALAAHLENHRSALMVRQDKGEFWWELRPCDYYGVFESEKIIFPDICKGPRFHLDTTGSYILNTAYALGSNDRYLLGFLNSKLFWWLIAQISIPFGVRAGQFRYRLIYQYMAKVPIRAIDFTDAADVELHGRMVALVESMLTLHARRAAERNPDTLRMVETDIAATDRRIDRLVYQLYALTEEEIALVEA